MDKEEEWAGINIDGEDNRAVEYLLEDLMYGDANVNIIQIESGIRREKGEH